MEIKTHFILNFQRAAITTTDAWATRPPLPLGFSGGGGTGGEEDASCQKHANTKKREVQREITLYIFATVGIEPTIFGILDQCVDIHSE
jgi:hypothetical protein